MAIPGKSFVGTLENGRNTGCACVTVMIPAPPLINGTNGNGISVVHGIINFCPGGPASRAPEELGVASPTPLHGIDVIRICMRDCKSSDVVTGIEFGESFPYRDRGCDHLPHGVVGLVDGVIIEGHIHGRGH